MVAQALGGRGNRTSFDDDQDYSSRRRGELPADSLGTDKEIPKGIHEWTVDRRFGDIQPAQPDTLSHLFQNTIFTSGRFGEYNTTGNLGTPRINRIFYLRPETEQFIFTQPYDYFVRQPEEYHFTNTLSPITNLTYNSAGNRTNGENHLTAKFAVNAGKRIGVGFLFDYIYGRGYYDAQSTSLFNYSMHGSYLGERYQAHLLLSTNHQKVAENGGITNDFYITHPESFNDNYQTSEIPTVLTRNWNRNDHHHIFLSHRYSLGFKRKVPMTEDEIKARKFAIESKRQNELQKAREKARQEAEKRGDDFDDSDNRQEPTFSGRPDNAAVAGQEPADSTTNTAGQRIAVNGKAQADSLLSAQTAASEDTTWLKDQYVPVTSFIHTLRFDTSRRIYQAYTTPEDYYANTYFLRDDIYDLTNHRRIVNTFAVSLLEGFNKWAKAGLKAFATSDLRLFTLPDSEQRQTAYNEHTISIGGQLDKRQGQTLHYSLTAETWLLGEDFGQLHFDADADINMPLLGDTLTVAAKGFSHRDNPSFYLRHFHARNLWWDNDLDKQYHNRLQGTITLPKTKTKLTVAIDNINKYTYLGTAYSITSDYLRKANATSVRQTDASITVLTAALSQDLRLGPIHWDNIITFQKTSNQDILPLPSINVYTNLYLRFQIARVLHCDLGADLRYFTRYYAPDYSPIIGQYAVQEGPQRIELGNYPIANVYANFHLHQARFFVLFSHANAGSGNRNYFLTPHYPLNERVLRLGISWNFFN